MAVKRKSVFLLFIALLFLGVLAFGWWMYRWQYNRADTILENWARSNHFKVIDKQKANFGTGPEAVRAGNKQVTYRITVEGPDGARRTGLARIGSEEIGTISDNISVEWDK